MRTKICLTTIILTLMTVLSACAPDESLPRMLNVQGSAQAILTPDIAYISIGVHTEHEDAVEAVADNTAQAQEIHQSLTALGLDSRDIQTTNFSIYPQEQWSPEGERQGVLFMVDNTVYVTMRDLTKIGEILDAVVKAGANSIYGITFDVSDKTSMLADTRQAAIENARTQAEEIAQAAGVELGPIQSINFYGGYPVPVYEGKGGGAMMYEAAGQVPVSPGQMVITVDVNLTYEIR